MKLFLQTLLFSLLIFSCRKEETLPKVTYALRENSSASPTISITYTSSKSGTSTISSTNSNYWSSQAAELEHGQFFTMKAECTEPLHDIEMYIYVDGGLWKVKRFQSPVSQEIISGNIP